MLKKQYYFRCKKCMGKVTELIPRNECVTYAIGLRIVMCDHVEFDRIVEE